MGSVLGTIKDVVDQRREAGEKIGVLGICSFRPFPFEQVAHYLGGAKRFICLEKAFSLGIGGIVAPHCRSALSMVGKSVRDYEVIAGLGGRNITERSLNQMIDQALTDQLEHLTFLDLDRELVEAELKREQSTRRSGPISENIQRHATQRANAARGI